MLEVKSEDVPEGFEIEMVIDLSQQDLERGLNSDQIRILLQKVNLAMFMRMFAAMSTHRQEHYKGNSKESTTTG